jgi:hypothetical protein
MDYVTPGWGQMALCLVVEGPCDGSLSIDRGRDCRLSVLKMDYGLYLDCRWTAGLDIPWDCRLDVNASRDCRLTALEMTMGRNI